MPLVQCLFPAPWWTPLSYSCERALPEGLRVSAPLGRGRRVAVTVEAPAGDFDIEKTRPLSSVIDDEAPLPAELWRLVKWFGETWFIGAGFAMKSLLPSKFFTDEKLPPLPRFDGGGEKFSAEDVYSADCRMRWERYRDAIEQSPRSSLALFPEVKMAAAFWESLPSGLRADGALWPESPARQWKLWKCAREGNIRFIVGPPGAAFVPLAGLSSIIMDEENQGGWRTQSHPVFHLRPLLGMRAIFCGARFILGGMMPSSKGYLRAEPECLEKNNESRLIFVSVKEASSSEVASLRDRLPISSPLIRETSEVRREGKWAFWLLDRKGYAGEISCDECGGALRCERCGSIMRWEEKKHCLSCISCGSRRAIPELCPNCGGTLLRGSRPGLEALYERVSGALRERYKNVLLFQSREEKLPSAEELTEKYPGGALIIGTRKLLSLCDGLSPALIGWIDADAETRSAEYDAKARAYGMIWESMWRGGSERKIVIQSRRPGKGWQEGLRRGWKYFWRRELKEREEWELPPYTPMIKISMPRGGGAPLSRKLEERGLEYWISDEKENEIWVRGKQFRILKEILSPSFDISRAGKAFPSVLLYLD